MINTLILGALSDQNKISTHKRFLIHGISPMNSVGHQSGAFLIERGVR